MLVTPLLELLGFGRRVLAMVLNSGAIRPAKTEDVVRQTHLGPLRIGGNGVGGLLSMVLGGGEVDPTVFVGLHGGVVVVVGDARAGRGRGCGGRNTDVASMKGHFYLLQIV